MYKPQYSLIYGNNHNIDCPDLGENFNVENFVNKISDCGVDYLTFNARGNQGFAYYDTKLGIKHPALKYNLFDRLINACQLKGIAVCAYLNGGISNEEGIRHRDWTTLYSDGRSYRETRESPYIRTMCYNSPYREHLIAMIKEIAKKYPITGFFIDCLQPYPCICPTCIRQMKKQGIDWQKQAEIVEFSSQSADRLCSDIAKAAHEINPELLLYFNGRGYDEQFGVGNLLECESVTRKGFSFLEASAHHLRTFGNVPIINMVTRFCDWSGDYGTLRSAEALKYELLYGLMHGMRPSVGSFLHPRGDYEDIVLSRIKEVYQELHRYDSYWHEAKNITEIAIVFPENIRYMGGGGIYAPLCGAVQMLEELKMQFDVVTLTSAWDKYNLLIFPDTVEFTAEITKRVKQHLAKGRKIIASAYSGISAKLPEWGIDYLGEADYDPTYFITDKKLMPNKLPDCPISIAGKGVKIIPKTGTVTPAMLVSPYYQRGWDGERALYYSPPDKVTEFAALSLTDQVAHFSHKIFSSYFEKPVTHLRDFFEPVLSKMLARPLLKLENMPAFTRASVTAQPGRFMIHLLAYYPEFRGMNDSIIEEPALFKEVTAYLRIGNLNPKQVYLGLNGKALNFSNKKDYIKIAIPEVYAYTLIVIEDDHSEAAL